MVLQEVLFKNNSFVTAGIPLWNILLVDMYEAFGGPKNQSLLSIVSSKIH